ncbi:polysaccharide deacetylase family protein [Bacillus manliponensis]|uniref:polysaccharide deacetylase family protein n=1 Tax=Bacillus manliponensis TaxID=574376 RepID=UPI0035121854
MKKSTYMTLFLSTILIGCENSNTDSKSVTTKEQQTPKKAVAKTPDLPLTQGMITWDPFEHNAKSTTLYVKNLTDTFQEVRYTIWRTADGPKQKQTFVSQNQENYFSLPFHLQNFQLKRGEYKIETTGLKADGSETNLAKSTITFEQYVPILMYHAIAKYEGPEDGDIGLYVSPEQFEKQMQYLKDNGHTLLTFERWNEINRVNKPVFVTFDDGRKDNMNALHILQKLKDDTFQPTATEFIVSNTINTENRLTIDDIKQMVNSGIFSIQGHTANHTMLEYTSNYDEELRVSKEKIESITGKNVIALAYPVGSYNEAAIEETKKHYQFAVTTDHGNHIVKGENNEQYTIKRHFVGPNTTINKFVALVKEVH